MDIFDQIELNSPVIKPKFSRNNGKGDIFDHLPDVEEGGLKTAARYGAQVPLGYAQATPYGIATNFVNLLAMGDVLDPEEEQRIREISEREGIPFDEEKYREAQEQALGSFPTPSNIARMTEEATGLPLTPKTKGQKLLQLGVSAGKFQPGAASQKAVAGVTAPTISAVSQELGLPEPFADLAGLGVGTFAAGKTPEVSLQKTKPSGLPERQFENLKAKREVSEKKLGQINEKLESDFKKISDRIIEESPIGETAKNLKNDPTFIQESRQLLNRAQEIADAIPTTVLTNNLKKEIADLGAKNTKGVSLSEYDKNYLKFTKENIDGLISKNATPGELVQQYRKNNQSLGEYFEPGSSKALNRAKRDAILDYNRAIANVIEKTDPELSAVFKEGNERWTKIKNTQAMDDFVNEIFSEKVNYKKLHDFFDKTGYDRIFKNSLGEKGYQQFEQLVTDMLTSENPYKMLKVAKANGYEDLFKTGLGYILHPKIGIAKAGLDAAKYTWKGLMNSILDKPKIAFSLNKAVNDVKIGKFKDATKEFTILDKEVKASAKLKGETIEVVPEKIEAPRNQLEAPRKELEYKEPQAKQKSAPEASKKVKPKQKKTKIETKPKKPSENLTEPRIESIKKQDISKEGLKSQKDYILKKIETAKAKPQKTENITIDVPGDGIFKIKNNEKALDKFSENVQKKWPDKPYKAPIRKKYPNYPENAFKDYEIKKIKDLKNEINKQKETEKKRRSFFKKKELEKEKLKESLVELQNSIKDTKSVISSTKDPKVEKMFKNQLKIMKKEEAFLKKEINKKFNQK